jgi:hypothetical protein
MKRAQHMMRGEGAEVSRGQGHEGDQHEAYRLRKIDEVAEKQRDGYRFAEVAVEHED